VKSIKYISSYIFLTPFSFLLKFLYKYHAQISFCVFIMLPSSRTKAGSRVTTISLKVSVVAECGRESTAAQDITKLLQHSSICFGQGKQLQRMREAIFGSLRPPNLTRWNVNKAIISHSLEGEKIPAQDRYVVSSAVIAREDNWPALLVRFFFRWTSFRWSSFSRERPLAQINSSNYRAVRSNCNW
jgi:hypothetical protein